jgi:hypothetical protein
VGKIHWGLDPA